MKHEMTPLHEAVETYREACSGKTTWKGALSSLVSVAIWARALPELDEEQVDIVFFLWKMARQRRMDELGVESWGENVHQW